MTMGQQLVIPARMPRAYGRHGQHFGPSGRLPSASSSLAEAIDLRKLVLMFRRRIRLFLGLALAVFLAAAAGTLLMPREYTASSQLMFDPRQERVVRSDAVVPNMTIADEAAIDSEVEMLQSREMALAVVQRLGLQSDPMFNKALREPTLADRLKAMVKSPRAPATAAEAQRRAKEGAAAKLQQGLTVRRAGLTYVVDILVSTRDPRRSAQIANAYAQQYVDGQMNAKLAATNSANHWLIRRLAELEPELAQKEARVAAYRQRNNLLSASGATLAEQEISNYNQQMAAARTDLATEHARLNTARRQLAAGSSGDDVAAALDSPVIQELRGQRALASSKVADLSQRYGPRHPALVRAREELGDVDQQIDAEINRVVSNLEAKVQVAQERAASISGTLGGARGVLASNNAASVQLNTLERDAQVARADYESLLTRYRETATQAGIQEADARVVSQARTPSRPSSPNVPLNLALGMALALAVGAAGVGVSTAIDESLATAQDVEEKLGAVHLGSIPLVASVADRRDKNLSPGQYLLLRPLSAFAEAFRALRTAIIYGRVGDPVRTVAVTSALPGEGKTSVSLCLARSAAQAGMKVVVVDCDLRRRSLNRELAIKPRAGLVEVLQGRADLDDALVTDEGGAQVLPIADVEGAQDILSGPAVKDLLKALNARFDLVVLDTPPVLAMADTRVLSGLADCVLFLTHWRKTSVRAVEAAMTILAQADARVDGVVLTQVDANEQARSGYGDPGYYYPELRKYYSS